MLVRHYKNESDFEYIVKEVSNRQGKRYRYYTEDPCETIDCINCGKEVKNGLYYTSKEWFSPSGLWGFGVCEECYKKEWERIIEMGKYNET